jgi:hypothetical protein
VPGDRLLAFALTDIETPFPLSLPEVAESTSQLLLPLSPVALQATGKEQLPVSLNDRFCADVV